MTPSALAQLYDAHSASIFAFALNLTRDGEAGREILQEVFLRMARRSDLEIDSAGVRSWLFRMAHNLIIDRHRRADARARTIERAALEPVNPFVPHIDPDEQAFQTAVAAAMRTLPEEQRAVVHLKLWEQLSFSEIGNVLDLNPNTAASRYRYALEKLQSELRPLYEEIR
ncbi:MAG: sigma-70 family RNA polymerase sigma factor [Verrucomicrobiota bacterium]